MTYCVAIKLNAGMVFLSDTRTNAGIDNIAKFKKMFTWENPGERCITMMTSGNLSITQAAISLLQENIDDPANGLETILSAPSMFKVAELVGDAMQLVQARYGAGLAQSGESTASSILVSIPREISSKPQWIRRTSKSANTNTASRSLTASSPPKRRWTSR